MVRCISELGQLDEKEDPAHRAVTGETRVPSKRNHRGRSSGRPHPRRLRPSRIVNRLPSSTLINANGGCDSDAVSARVQWDLRRHPDAPVHTNPADHTGRHRRHRNLGRETQLRERTLRCHRHLQQRPHVRLRRQRRRLDRHHSGHEPVLHPGERGMGAERSDHPRKRTQPTCTSQPRQPAWIASWTGNRQPQPRRTAAGRQHHQSVVCTASSSSEPVPSGHGRAAAPPP